MKFSRRTPLFTTGLTFIFLTLPLTAQQSLMARAGAADKSFSTPQLPSLPPGNGQPGTAAPITPGGPEDLDWTPPELTALNAHALARTSFTLNRSMLESASSLLPDSDRDLRRIVSKLDGVNVHLLRFGFSDIDEQAVAALRQSYHRRGWHHMVSASASNAISHGQSTDLWVAFKGFGVRGAVVLIENPKNLALVTFKGDLSPADLLRLRGHFGIPHFDGDRFREDKP